MQSSIIPSYTISYHIILSGIMLCCLSPLGGRFGMVWGGFWEGVGCCLMDSGAFKTSQIFDSKLKPEKVVLETRKGSRGGVRDGSGGPKLVNDE